MTATALGVSCLAHVFSALLPPDSNEQDEEEDFYDILEISRNASTEDVRKAYKKKSLSLHPDKIAQKGGDAEAAAKQYEKVQEAHGVLSNPKKRKLYHALGCNPTRYRFINSGSHHNPTALYENLGRASCAAKSRIIVLVACLLCLVLLQPILMVVKINHDLKESGALENTPWTVILIPWWVLHGSYVAMWLLIFCMAAPSEKCGVCLTLFEQVCWLAWEVLLAIRWDNTVDWNYVDIFVPFYLVILLRIIQPLLIMKRIRRDCNKMISLQYLEQHVLDGRRYEDLTEEEQAQLQEEFILVHNDIDDSDIEVFEDEADLEEARVHSSPDFHHAMDVYYAAFSKFFNTVLFAPAFCVLCVLRLDDHISVSWWVVFIPVWVHFGWRVLSNMWLCCCASVAGEEILIGGVNMNSNESSAGGETETDNVDRGGVVDASENTAAENKKEDSDFGSSTAFAPVDGSMTSSAAFAQGSSTTREQDGVAAEEVSNKAELSTPSTKGEPSAPATIDDSAAAPDVVELYSKDEEEAKHDNKENSGEAAAQEDEEFHIDPETFQEWQSAYQEAEASAMEAQAKAQSDCLLVSLELTILCLLVGKLDKAYESMPGDDIGYNAIWIIFPILLLAGLALCCCACLIYGAGRVDAPESMGSHVAEEEQEPLTPTDETQTKTSSTEGVAASTTTASATTSSPTEETKVDEEGGGGGYDADDID